MKVYLVIDETTSEVKGVFENKKVADKILMMFQHLNLNIIELETIGAADFLENQNNG